jgi:signal peptidase I
MIKAKGDDSNRKSIYVTVIFVAIMIVLRLFVLRPYFVSGTSMQPTYQNGAFVMGIHHFKPTRNSIVTVAHKATDGDDVIKRLIGLPGDVIKIEGNDVYVNDKKLNEKYLIDYPDGTSFNYDGSATKTYKLNSNQYFVLGDNRLNSNDSRLFGAVNGNELESKIIMSVAIKLG